MKRTTILLPDDVDAQLRYEAKRRGMSMTELAGEAIAAYLVQPSEDGRDLSIFDLGDGDIDSASELDRYVGKAIERHHRER